MFASKNTLKYSYLLILFSTLMCASHSQAQQQESTKKERIDRSGDTNTDEWEMDLRLPVATTPVPPGPSEVVLPDEEQNQKLQQLLSKMAANPRDAGVLAQLNALLVDVLGQINTLMDAGLIDQA